VTTAEELEAVERSYRRNPLFFAYLYHDLLHEPDATEAYIKTAGGYVRGYILIYWRPRWCPAVHIVGDVDEVKLPHADCIRMHLESGVKIKIPRGARREQAITMACDPQCAEKAREILASGGWAVKAVAPEDYHPTSPLVDVEYLFSRCRVYGIYAGGKPATTAAVCVSLPEVWIITDVYTRPEYRGRGLATYLIAYITLQALAAGATPALSVVEDNAVAIKTYRKVGYRAVRTFLLIITDTNTRRTPTSP
jgi:GNAT superfamily N-acetyltransferase